MTMNSNQPGTPAPRISGVIRSFIRAGGRILVTPAGELSEGGGVPWPLIDGSDEEAAECLRAGRAYFNVRDLPAASQQISRTVHSLGRRTDHGWIILEANATKRKRGAH